MIRASRIHVTFNKGTPLETVALRDVDLMVESGQFLTVIGSNGAGKTTALNVISGTIRPDGGRIDIDGTDVTTWPTHRRARLVSRVFQDPKVGTCEDLTILENFALAEGRTAPRKLRFAIDRSIRERAAERLKLLKLGPAFRRSAAGGRPADGDERRHQGLAARRAHRRARPQDSGIRHVSDL
jgi:putative ABC transport system ATP-binding protein